MTNRVLEILKCVAKSSSIASALIYEGYVVYTYGWDKVEYGHYYAYDEKSGGWYLDDSLLKIEKEKEMAPQFYYRCAIDAAIVSTLKKMAA